MTRAEYLEKCQIVSEVRKGLLKKPISELIPDKCLFIVNGIECYPVGYILSFEDGKPKHTAILHEKGSHCEYYFNLMDLNGREKECIKKQ